MNTRSTKRNTDDGDVADEEQTSFFSPRIRIFLRWIMIAVAVVAFVIVNDAFLMKYGASYTIAGTLSAGIEFLHTAIRTIGTYLGRVLNVVQFVYDAVEYIIERVKPYLPLEELARSRQAVYAVINEIVVFFSIGWLADGLKGFAETLSVSAYLPTSLLVVLVFYVYYKQIRGVVNIFNTK